MHRRRNDIFLGLDVNKLSWSLKSRFYPTSPVAVTNTTNDKKRGQIVPYADSRAYTDRLNALFTPQGWTVSTRSRR